MELLLLFTLITANTQAYTIEAKEKSTAEQIIEINEKSFSHKKIINTPSLCEYHNQLLKEVGRAQLSCGRRITPSTKEAEVAKQIQEADKLTQMTAPSVDDMIINMPRRK